MVPFFNVLYYVKYVSESNILGPNGNLSDIKNLVSFERELLKNLVINTE